MALTDAHSRGPRACPGSRISLHHHYIIIPVSLCRCTFPSSAGFVGSFVNKPPPAGSVCALAAASGLCGSAGCGGSNKGLTSVFSGGAKVLPSVTHSALGTMYEEPCVVFIRVGVAASLCGFA